LRGSDQPRDVQVAVARRRRADADVLVGKAHVQRLAVRLAVYRDCADAHLAARADDAQRNLAAVRDQYFLEHRPVTSTARCDTAPDRTRPGLRPPPGSRAPRRPPRTRARS